MTDAAVMSVLSIVSGAVSPPGWKGNLTVAQHPSQSRPRHIQLRLRDPQTVSVTPESNAGLVC